MNTVSYSIPNISCKHCVHTITSELSDLAGVTEVKGDVTTKTVQVTFGDPATHESIEALLAEINYPAVK